MNYFINQKYIPDVRREVHARNDRDEPGVAAGGGVSHKKKLAERRFKRFKNDIEEVIGRGNYDEEDFKNLKDFKKDTHKITDKYEEIIT